MAVRLYPIYMSTGSSLKCRIYKYQDQVVNNSNNDELQVFSANFVRSAKFNSCCWTCEATPPACLIMFPIRLTTGSSSLYKNIAWKFAWPVMPFHVLYHYIAVWELRVGVRVKVRIRISIKKKGYGVNIKETTTNSP